MSLGISLLIAEILGLGHPKSGRQLPLGEVMVLPKIADPFIVSHNSSIDIHLDILTLIRPDDIMPM